MKRNNRASIHDYNMLTKQFDKFKITLKIKGMIYIFTDHQCISNAKLTVMVYRSSGLVYVAGLHLLWLLTPF